MSYYYYYYYNYSSSSIHHIASTLIILLLILIPSLKLLINGLNSISTLVLSLFFKAPPFILLSFLKGLTLQAQAFLSAFQVLAEAFRSILVTLIGVVLEILSSFLMAVLELLMSLVFGSFASASGSGLGDLFEKAKASFQGSLFEQVRAIVGSVFEIVVDSALDMASSFVGSLFDLATTGISTLMNEPGSVIGQMVENLKSSLESDSSREGVRGIVGTFIENVVNVVLGLGISSSISGLFEFLKNIFGMVRDSGYRLGGILENTRVALDILGMQELRRIIEDIGKLGMNMIIEYFIG